MIHVAVDDVAFVSADAIVRPSTTTLEPTTPALRRLEQVGGPRFWEQLHVKQELEVGAAVVTSSGDLTAELVIHAIIRSTSEPVTRAGVRHALRSTLQRARDWEINHIAVPPVGTGAGNLSVEDAADVMCSVFAEVGDPPFPTEITIVVETEDERAVFQSRIQKLSQ